MSQDVPPSNIAALSELKHCSSKFSRPEHRVDLPEPMFGSSEPLEWLTELTGPTIAGQFEPKVDSFAVDNSPSFL